MVSPLLAATWGVILVDGGEVRGCDAGDQFGQGQHRNDHQLPSRMVTSTSAPSCRCASSASAFGIRTPRLLPQFLVRTDLSVEYVHSLFEAFLLRDRGAVRPELVSQLYGGLTEIDQSTMLVRGNCPRMDDRNLLTAALADRYRPEGALGAGGMATVYLAYDTRHLRQVAIKVLHAELRASFGAERFLSEIRITANLQHPHIV